MKYKDSINWLESLKQQIGQAQHSDLWHFEQAIDETIANLRPLAEPHGRLIDADKLFCKIDGIKGWDYGDESDMAISAAEALSAIDDSPTVIEAEE